MSCGGRVYKGDTILVSIPFDISGYTDLVVSYFTVGDTKIVRTESELDVEDGYITVQFSGHDLDILPDGVLRYTVEYAVDNTDYVESTNTMLYLKTPASYSAVTEEVIYEEGFESGYTKGVGECEEIAEEAYADGYQSGTTDGYSSGYSVGFVAGIDNQRQRLVSTAITSNGVYERTDGFNYVDVQVPLDTPCNIEPTKSINLNDYSPSFQTTVTPDEGYAGLEAVSVNGSDIYSRAVGDVQAQFVTLSATTNGTYLPQSTFAVFKEVYVNVDTDCSSAITEAYQSGYTEGIEAQKERMTSITITANTAVTRTDGWNQITVNVPQSRLQSKSYVLGVNFAGASGPITPDLGYDGFSSFEVSDEGYGQGKFEEGRLQGEYYGYKSGHNDGMIEGFQSGMTAGAAEQKSKLGRTVQTSNGTFTTAGDGWSAVTVNVPSKKPKVQGHISAETQIHVYDIIANQYSVGYENFITHVDGEPIGTGLGGVIPAGYHLIEVFAMNDTDWIGVQVQGNNYWLSVISLTY